MRKEILKNGNAKYFNFIYRNRKHSNQPWRKRNHRDDLKRCHSGKNPVVCKTESDVPVSLSEASKEQIALAFKGYEYSPLLVMIYVIAADAKDYSAALNYFKTVKFDYLVAPSAETDKQTTAIVNYVKSERGSGKLIKAVLPNTTADCEGIVNFATEKVIAGSKTYTTEQYCSRLPGLSPEHRYICPVHMLRCRN